ncbi:IclR family transcriptional regulator [Rhodococcus rhodnii]|uniref:IclR family transcriptional regulator n=2 Tax=Rhodococcus rhodnii TaxID=38312 RepID=R7WTG8_9NOCA|nr:IclR family transcriptional regulator [Rhodococcus rhodnii]EOM78543.1 IclR family transcriptional regulator [Rhodococcus rhodnii LMG 5362]TXG91331.1 IclR family transcriptional regulator [Rhodococcus rhodnii]
MTTACARDDRAAIDKAVSLLACFGEDGLTGVGVSELARRADLSKSTTHRVLAMLERNGVVERVGTDYRLGNRLHEIGRTMYAPGQEELRDRLIPFLAELFAATQETVHLAALYDTDVVYLAKLYGHRQVPSPSRIGHRIPAHCTAVGKALLAYDPDAMQAALAAPLRRYTDRTIVDPVALATELSAIRRLGIAVENGEIQSGLSCVAVPVIGPSGRPVAALSVSGATDRLDVRTHAATLRRVASDAARVLPTRRRQDVRTTPPRVQHALAG